MASAASAGRSCSLLSSRVRIVGRRQGERNRDPIAHGRRSGEGRAGGSLSFHQGRRRATWPGDSPSDSQAQDAGGGETLWRRGHAGRPIAPTSPSRCSLGSNILSRQCDSTVSGPWPGAGASSCASCLSQDLTARPRSRPTCTENGLGRPGCAVGCRAVTRAVRRPPKRNLQDGEGPGNLLCQSIIPTFNLRMLAFLAGLVPAPRPGMRLPEAAPGTPIILLILLIIITRPSGSAAGIPNHARTPGSWSDASFSLVICAPGVSALARDDDGRESRPSCAVIISQRPRGGLLTW